MLKLKLQDFGHLMPRADSLEKKLMLGKIAGRGKRRQQGRRWIDSITNSMDMSLSEVQEMVKDMLQFMASQRDKTVQLNNNNNTLQVLNK